MQDVRYFPLLGAAGLATGDVNGDGLDDLFVCQEAGLDLRYILQQGTGQAQPVRTPDAISLPFADQALPPEDSSARIFLRRPLPMLGADYTDADGTARPIPLNGGDRKSVV